MKVIDTEISGVKIIEPDVFGDERGWFCETYNAERYHKAGITNTFVPLYLKACDRCAMDVVG